MEESLRKDTAMIRSHADFVTLLGHYIKVLDAFCQKHGLQGRVVVDHVCIKCETTALFEQIRTVMEGTFVDGKGYSHTSIIGGRRIAYMSLLEPLMSSVGPVGFLELAEPKPTKREGTRFHHFEIYDRSGDYDGLVAHIAQGGEVVESDPRPYHPTDDVILPDGFIIRLTRGPLINKIKEEEMK